MMETSVQMEMRSNVSRMYSHIFSFVESCLVRIAAEFNICDHLLSKAMNAKDLAAILGKNEESLSRILRGLSLMGILREEENETYSVTTLGETLTSKSPFSVKNVTRFVTTELYTAITGLSESMENGKSSFELIYDMPFYEFMKNNDERREIFFKSMTELHQVDTVVLQEAIDFKKYNNIVDVGGGSGDLIRDILKQNQTATGVLFDLEHIIKGVEQSLKAEFGDRCIPVGGNFFDDIPTDGDCYILRKVIFNWDDEKALIILRNIRNVMTNESKLFIIEPMFEKNIGINVDFLLMAQNCGKVRSVDQFRKLLLKAGLRISRFNILKHSFHDIIEVSAS